MKFKFLFFLFFLNFFSCNTAPFSNTETSSTETSSIDESLQQAADNIEQRLEQGTEIALINVHSPSNMFSEYVLNYLESVFINNGRLIVLDRSNLDKIRQEQGFQLSGNVSDESAKAIGQMLGAGAIITGSLIDLGDSYRLTLKAIKIETAVIVASYPVDIQNNRRVNALLSSGNTNTVNNQVQSQPNQTAASQAPVAYRIGDTGPAGGLIFFDKSNNIGGWRYLEAAPPSTEARVIWSQEYIWNNEINDSDSVLNQRSLGLGYSNTQKIMRIFVNRGGGFNTAARICFDLEINGLDDWFLPSIDELNWMYGNLHGIGLGEFKNERRSYYWSSTQDSFSTITTIDFSNGNRNRINMRESHYVRAIRRF